MSKCVFFGLLDRVTRVELGASDLRHKRAGQDVGAWDKASLLEGFAGGDVVGAATGARNAAHLIADLLQFLHYVAAQAALTEWLLDSHVNVAVGAVVMKHYSAC